MSTEETISGEDLLPPGERVDLNNCDREPIHTPGSIQPHGVLLVLDEADWTITQASASLMAHFGVEAGTLLGEPLKRLLEESYIARLRDMIADGTLDGTPVFAFRTEGNGAGSTGAAPPFEWVLHRAHGRLVLEGEPALPDVTGREQRELNDLVRQAIPRLQNAPDLTTLYQVAATEVRRLTGFDRVMIYRFDPDGHGEVVAEDKRDDIAAFLGLHYPATDIPKQARRLYILNQLRLIADVGYTPAPILALAGTPDAAPLDMSYCALRSVSPIHIEYLKNMGVASSMSVSIVQDGELWGLIACHHYDGPNFVSFGVRSACELMGQMVALQLGAKAGGEDSDYRARIHQIHSRLVEQMAAEEDYRAGLYRHRPDVRDLIDAGGCALVFDTDEEMIRLGDTPTEGQVARLLAFLDQREEPNSLFVTDRLPSIFPDADFFQRVASGVLAVPLSRVPRAYLLWFRPEVLQTVYWGGNPAKNVETDADGSERLTPRKSFDRWREEVHGRSLPWKPVEIEAATELRRAIQSVILSKAEELARLNAELLRSNVELDSFAYVASHDLKEPLRGIHNYVQFLQEDHEEQLSDEAKDKLETLARLSKRMESLIDTLLHYSRVGRLELAWADVDMNEVLADALESLRVRLVQSGAEVRIPRPLPTAVHCDPIQIGEVFTNLISNAVKYNDHPAGEKWVEIGYAVPGDAEFERFSESVRAAIAPPVFYVRDNGIGILEKHQEMVFRIFKRLHARAEYGGGTGAGLTIAHKIVERHGGQIWVESKSGSGTTFYFTLAAREEAR